MIDNRNAKQIKLAGLKRHLIWSCLSKPYNMVLVTEFPKSGASWMALLLSEYLEIPFRRSESAKFEHCVMHGHYLPSSLMNRPIAVMRDGRDVMVSYYHHMLIGNDQMPSYSAIRARKTLGITDVDNVRENMPLFIKYLFQEYPKKTGFMYFSWEQYVRSIIEGGYFYVRYEDMKKNTAESLVRTLHHIDKNIVIDERKIDLIVESMSFETQSGRKAGLNNKKSYLRKGIVGDWKNYFNEDSIKLFDRYANSSMKALGYN